MIPQGPSIFDAGSIAGLNPFQRPQLRGPTEEPPETGSRQQDLPDHGLIMIMAFFVIAAAVAIHSQQKKHPAWKQPADILLVVGTVLTYYRHSLPVISYFDPQRTAPDRDTRHARAHCNSSVNLYSRIMEPLIKTRTKARNKKIYGLFFCGLLPQSFASYSVSGVLELYDRYVPTLFRVEYTYKNNSRDS